METVAALLDGFVSIMYANHYTCILMEKAGLLFIFSAECSLLAVFNVLLFIYFNQINLQSST